MCATCGVVLVEVARGYAEKQVIYGVLVVCDRVWQDSDDEETSGDDVGTEKDDEGARKDDEEGRCTRAR